MTDQVIDHLPVQDADLGFDLELARQEVAAEAARAERWTYVCRSADLTAGRGVAALVDGLQVAVFRLGDGSLHAVGNYDPAARAWVISRGLTGTHDGLRTVASPLYKDLFDLRTGRCLTKDGLTLPVYPVFRHRGLVFCQGDPLPAADPAALQTTDSRMGVRP